MDEAGLFKFKHRKGDKFSKKSKFNSKIRKPKNSRDLNSNSKNVKTKKNKHRVLSQNSNSLEKEKKPLDIEQLNQQIKELMAVEEPDKKTKKKIRRLEYLHRKITQSILTQQSLSLENEIDQQEQESNNSSNEEDGKEDPIIEKNISRDDKENSDSEVEDDKSTKRFVLFVGNLPYNVTESEIMQHFQKVGNILSVRIPEQKESRKKGFAFMELSDRISYEKTLSMHHTMMKNKRINVHYTNPDGKKFDRKEAMRKNAKFDAMRKAGKLAGSIPEHQKRSFRRKKKRLAEEKAAAGNI